MNKVVLVAFVAVVCYLAAPVNGAPQHKEHEVKHGEAPRHDQEQKKPIAHDQHPKVHDQRPQEHGPGAHQYPKVHDQRPQEHGKHRRDVKRTVEEQKKPIAHDQHPKVQDQRPKEHASGAQQQPKEHEQHVKHRRDVQQTEEEQKKPVANDQRPKEQAAGETHDDRLPHPRPPTRRRYTPTATPGNNAATIKSSTPLAHQHNRKPYKPTTAASAPGTSSQASVATPAVPAASPAVGASSTTVQAPSSGTSAGVSASSTAAPSVPSVSTSAAPLPAVLG
ncbi:activating signal cointegrator 1 complex subunit 2 homolog [Anopheles aquasalis]|uniref:activating signal cointegrator 1 complex subunit 2 homolog n=1 Tax=Anopheles aquasalis TaxID=42839 RepID=UPI00215B59C8|nr:activating signal cointegrator 1 complex subunit 2 homolog [Anopheles aquasalis]